MLDGLSFQCNERIRVVPDSTCMYRGSSDTEDCKLHEAEKLGLYINVTSGCEYMKLDIKTNKLI
jgi:hypothetical protein